MKVSNDAFEKFAKRASEYFDIKWGDLNDFKERMNLLGYKSVERYMQSLLPFDAVLIGDIFWDTCQNICEWCQINNIKCFFLQHGQWVYLNNKKNPPFLPYRTFLFGYYIEKMIMSWPYGKRSLLSAVGSPRYDECHRDTQGEYVYFSPPVMTEQNIGIAPKKRHGARRCIKQLSGLDKYCKMLIQPHYREAEIRGLKERFPTADFVSRDEDALSLISKASKVITHRCSTVILDAIALGKIVVLVNFVNELQSHFKRYHFKEFALESYNIEQCIQHLKSDHICYTEGYVGRAKPHIILGDSSSRIIKMIRADLDQ